MKHNIRINGEVKICGKEYPIEFQPMLGLYEINDLWSDSLEIVDD